ncbi:MULTISPECIES: beta-N-acetylhexosaminidase [unclassified Janthinobacterium]|uniref:beta-N-acetylhexosaminidase n=1 Tax=unclassified Janthinobacterium TaxID=2610881 RepID=UPI0003475A08|nr:MULTISPECIES: beta-N-acetylhexosaminidase [unclassified Janthinobacterium]MEC5162957.1 beta-N-acetylhexosaminidase [Janthinobacterium sp. CG_S6]
MTQAHDNHTFRRLAGQLIMIRFPGTELDAATAEFLRANAIRAVCLFRANMVDSTQLARLTADLRAAMGPQSLIAIDQEGGAVVRSTWVPAPPAAMALGAADDAELARAVGAAVARAARSLGFNWNFAPVLDLNNNPDNPVIAERSFGADPRRATELAMAWMAGSHSEGVACCVKHFPGHGDTHVDSHRDLPRVDKPLEELERFEFAPFRAAAPLAPAMMTAHIVYPALDADNPATMSRRILHQLLREEWRYDGVIITDGMDMHAIAGRYGVGNAAVRALGAGADMVMALGTAATQEETLAAIAAAIASGELDMEQVRSRLARLAALAKAYPCQARDYPEDEADRALMAAAWRRGLSARGAPRRPPAGARLRLVVRQDVVSDGVSEAGVPAAALAASLGQLYDVDMVTFADAERFDWAALPADGRFVVLASTSRLRYGPRARASWRPDLHLALWNPYQALDIDAPALLTYGFAAPALAAVNAWLGGELDAAGRCPVPGFE